MTDITDRPPRPDHARTAEGGLPAGTIIFTMEGALPVEFLTPGDRIITRAGMRVLRGIGRGIDNFTLEFDAPEIVYADGMQVLAGATR